MKYKAAALSLRNMNGCLCKGHLSLPGQGKGSIVLEEKEREITKHDSLCLSLLRSPVQRCQELRNVYFESFSFKCGIVIRTCAEQP